MDLSIIIVNWKSKDYLQKCMASISSETRELEYEIVVIDAGSFDGCGEMLKEKYPQVRFIQSEKNLGFVRANNAAFRASCGRTVLFLNPDTEIVGSAVKTMYEQLQTLPQAGAVGCKLLNTDGMVQTSCIQSLPTILNQMLDSEFLRARWPKSALWGMSPLFESDLRPKAVQAISGACVMLKRNVFEQVGLFSEDYFMYAEDLDLCYKVARAGYKNYYVPEATVIHFGGGSSGEAANNFSTVMMRESIWRFLKKTRGRVYGMGYRVSMLFCAFARLVLLFVLLPVKQVQRRRAAWDASFRKWRAVLQWSMNRHDSLKRSAEFH